VADSAAKPANKPAPSAKSAPAASTAGSAPSSAPNGAPQSAAPQKAPPPPVTVDDVIERAEDRGIPKGSTVRVSPDNPDVASKARKDELEDSLEACGIKLVWDSTMAKDGIVVEPPTKNGANAPQAKKK
jgi:hypothetical protein